MSQDQQLHIAKEKLEGIFSLEPHIDKLDFVNHLALEINRLILEDFPRLVQILYRLDIDEIQLKQMLEKYVYEDAGYVIAQLIIQREMSKVESRQQNREMGNIPEDEQW